MRPMQLALRRPNRDAAVADSAAGIARAPHVAVDVGAHAVGTALHAVDHAIAEQLAVGELVVGPYVEDIDLRPCRRPVSPGPLPVLTT